MVNLMCDSVYQISYYQPICLCVCVLMYSLDELIFVFNIKRSSGRAIAHFHMVNFAGKSYLFVCLSVCLSLYLSRSVGPSVCMFLMETHMFVNEA